MESAAPSRRGIWSVIGPDGPVWVGIVLVVGVIAAGVGVQAIFPPSPVALFTMSSSTSMSAESTSEIGALYEYSYVPAEDLSDEPGSGVIYALELRGDPLDLLVSLGELFDVAGQPGQSQYFDEIWPGYVMGPEDWSGPSLNLTWSGTGPWYYSNPAAYDDPVCSEIPAEEGSEEPGLFECESPEPRGPLPSVDEAKALAVGIFRSSGLDVDVSSIQVLADDEWGVGVSALYKVDGVDTALEWSAFWAPGPVLASVSGHAATAVSRGSFATISPLQAVGRLDSGQWWGSPPPAYHSSFDEIFHDEASTSEPIPEPGSLIEIRVESSEVALLLVWDAEFRAWIVPGYVLKHGPEPWNASAVISVEEGVIELPDPSDYGIMPLPEVQ